MSEASSNDTGAISNGDRVTVTSGAAAVNVTAWASVDDSTTAGFDSLIIKDDRAFNVGVDTRRVLFIRTRANPAITVDHRARIGGLTYEVRSIQELANRGELRVALARVAEG